jgi:hypothetical protein
MTDALRLLDVTGALGSILTSEQKFEQTVATCSTSLTAHVLPELDRTGMR